MAERGIIIIPQFTIEGNILKIRREFNRISLQHYLLYWDKLDWPENNIVPMRDEGSDIEFLKSAGILERSKTSMSLYYKNYADMVRDMQLGSSLIVRPGSWSLAQDSREFGPSEGTLEIRSKELELNSAETDFARVMLDLQFNTLMFKNILEPGSWSLGQDSQTLIAPLTGTVETRCIEVELYSAVPVPTPDVSFEDILDFKRRRNDELKSFRSAMDALYQEVIGAADIPRAKLQAIAGLESAVQELNKVFRENFARRFLSSLKVELNVPNITMGAAGGAVAASKFGLPLELGAAAGAIGAAVRFDLPYVRKGINIPDRLKDYAYLIHVERELR
jgi:hypothetical protein